MALIRAGFRLLSTESYLQLTTESNVAQLVLTAPARGPIQNRHPTHKPYEPGFHTNLPDIKMRKLPMASIATCMLMPACNVLD